MTLLFVSTRPDRVSANGGIWACTRPNTTAPWGKPRGVDEVNSLSSTIDPCLSSDGLGLIFSSTRRTFAQPDGHGGWKITRSDTPAAENASPAGGAGLEIRRPDGSGRRASADGHRVQDRAAATNWGEAYDLDRGQHVPRKK